MLFSLATFTLIHTGLSLIALLTGIGVVLGLLAGRQARSPGPWTTIYFVSAIATSVTGFGFPFEKLLPSHIVGMLSLLALAAALYARYAAQLAGVWRAVYAIATCISVYFLVFVSIAQAFSKVPALKLAAPTLSEPPFTISQGIVLLVFVALGIAAVRGSRRVDAALA